MFDSPIILTISFGLLFSAHIAIIIHILLTKHEEPVSAVAWIMAVILSPVVGIFFYLLFGINRLDKYGRRVKLSAELFDSDVDKNSIRKFIKEMSIFTSVPDTAITESNFRRTLDKLFPRTVVTAGNAVKLLKDGAMAYPEMEQAIKNAVHSIHLQSYIIMDDRVGRELFDLLADKAEAGVKVNVLYDGIGSLKSIFSNFFIRYSRHHPNLQIRSFSKINIFIPWRIQLRNHRKLLVVDGKVAFVGGININEGNTRRNGVPKRRYIHDLHCRIEGPAVIGFQKIFLRDWVLTVKGDLKSVIHAEDFQTPHLCGNNRLRVVDSGPGQNYEGTRKMFLAAAATAQKSLWIVTPYFVPDSAFVTALTMTAARGVEVIVIVPAMNHSPFVRAASRSIYRKLLASDIKIYEKHGMFSHIKAMLVDEQWCFMGSSNCDVRSFKLNYELDFCIESGDFIEALRQQLKDELSQSDPVSLKGELRKNIFIKLFENSCSLFTPVM